MENYQKHPIKLLIQDIFRAKQTENKYVYKLFDLSFKNVMIHGVVTSVYNTTTFTTNLELSDPTGCVQIYYDTRKRNGNISQDVMKDLIRSFGNFSRSGNDKAPFLASLLNYIEKKHKNPIDFEEGSYVNVIGDIFIDNFQNTRMVSAFQIKCTSVESDIIWLEEVRYLYNKYYLCEKEK